ALARSTRSGPSADELIRRTIRSPRSGSERRTTWRQGFSASTRSRLVAPKLLRIGSRRSPGAALFYRDIAAKTPRHHRVGPGAQSADIAVRQDLRPARPGAVRRGGVRAVTDVHIQVEEVLGHLRRHPGDAVVDRLGLRADRDAAGRRIV